MLLSGTFAYETNNNKKLVVGYYIDAAGILHGYYRDANGALHFPIDPSGLHCDNPVWT